MRRVRVTGGAGLIGSAAVLSPMREPTASAIDVNKPSYASNLDAVADVSCVPRHCFEKVDICDVAVVRRPSRQHEPDAVTRLATESRVDRSIGGPEPLIATDIVGTYSLLESGAGILGRSFGRGLDAIPLSLYIDRRGVR